MFRAEEELGRKKTETTEKTEKEQRRVRIREGYRLEVRDEEGYTVWTV